MSLDHRSFNQIDQFGVSTPFTVERFPIVVSPEVTDVIPDFHVDEERLAAFATFPEGPIGLSPGDLKKVAIIFDAKHNTNVLFRGMTVGSFDPDLSEPDIEAGSLLDLTTIRIAVRSVRKTRTSEDLENTLIHELRHAKQIIYGERSLKLGRYAMTASELGGGVIGAALELGIDGIHNELDVAMLVFSGLTGAFSGYRLGDRIAPHEREARRAARKSGYRGIITGSPDQA